MAFSKHLFSSGNGELKKVNIYHLQGMQNVENQIVFTKESSRVEINFFLYTRGELQTHLIATWTSSYTTFIVLVITTAYLSLSYLISISYWILSIALFIIMFILAPSIEYIIQS